MPRATRVHADRVGADQREADRQSTKGTGERQLDSDAAFQIRTAGQVGPTGRPLPDFPQPTPLASHGPARIIAMCNQKGGVGKTTTTINLGAALAEVGRRVLLVDFDPQGALSVGLGINPHQLDQTIYNLIVERKTTIDEVIMPTS